MKKLISGITQRILTKQLRDLEKDGIVRRTVEDNLPFKTEYSLTRLGKKLLIMIDMMGYGK